MLLRQVDDFAFAVPAEAIAKSLMANIDNHLWIRIKYLGILTMFNGMDVSQSQYYLKIHCTTHLTRIVHTHQWTEHSQTPHPIPYPADNVYTKNLDIATPPNNEKEQQQLRQQHGIHYRQVIGELIWPMVKCRLDISFHTMKLSQFMANPASAHYQDLRQLGSSIAKTLDLGTYYWRDEP
jgi:hypothetical protein